MHAYQTHVSTLLSTVLHADSHTYSKFTATVLIIIIINKTE